MTAPLSRHMVDDLRPQPHFGADMYPGDWGIVMLARIKKPPLRFKGRRLARHWQFLYAEEPIQITLWQRQKSGFVLEYSVLSENALRVDAKAAPTAQEAALYLEGLCKPLRTTSKVSRNAKSQPHEQDLVESILNLQMQRTFSQVFATQVGEALAAWDAILPRMSEPAQEGF